MSPPATVTDGTYSLARPLFLYVPESVLAGKPEVAAFLDFYLSNVNAEIADVGYFPVDQDVIDRQVNAVRAATDGDLSTAMDGGTIAVAGSSTVYPLTQRMAERFVEAGYQGEITVESTGTKAGFVAL